MWYGLCCLPSASRQVTGGPKAKPPLGLGWLFCFVSDATSDKEKLRTAGEASRDKEFCLVFWTDQVVALRTLTVPRSRLGRSQLEEIKEALVRKDGVACQELAPRVKERRRQTKQEVEDFEPRAREPDPSRVIYQA